MLSGGELVGVWPEGFKGIGKPYSERYKLQRFGRGGFVSAALRTGVPIVPLVGRRRRGDLPAGRQHPGAGPAARRAVHPDHAVLPAARPARAWCRCRRSGCWSSASRSAPTSTTGRGRRPDAGLQRHRPGARDDPADALRAADAAAVGLPLGRRGRKSVRAAAEQPPSRPLPRPSVSVLDRTVVLWSSLGGSLSVRSLTGLVAPSPPPPLIAVVVAGRAVRRRAAASSEAGASSHDGAGSDLGRAQRLGGRAVAVALRLRRALFAASFEPAASRSRPAISRPGRRRRSGAETWVIGDPGRRTGRRAGPVRRSGSASGRPRSASARDVLGDQASRAVSVVHAVGGEVAELLDRGLSCRSRRSRTSSSSDASLAWSVKVCRVSERRRRRRPRG